MATGDRSDNPCGEFGPTQQWAVVWFCSVVVIGAALTYNFCAVDRMMYDSNAEFFDYAQYRENRAAQSSLRTDSVDARAHGDLHSVLERRSR